MSINLSRYISQYSRRFLQGGDATAGSSHTSIECGMWFYAGNIFSETFPSFQLFGISATLACFSNYVLSTSADEDYPLEKKFY